MLRQNFPSCRTRGQWSASGLAVSSLQHQQSRFCSVFPTGHRNKQPGREQATLMVCSRQGPQLPGHPMHAHQLHQLTAVPRECRHTPLTWVPGARDCTYCAVAVVEGQAARPMLQVLTKRGRAGVRGVAIRAHMASATALLPWLKARVPRPSSGAMVGRPPTVSLAAFSYSRLAPSESPCRGPECSIRLQNASIVVGPHSTRVSSPAVIAAATGPVQRGRAQGLHRLGRALSNCPV